jgi:hypothetical protein
MRLKAAKTFSIVVNKLELERPIMALQSGCGTTKVLWGDAGSKGWKGQVGA